MGILETAKSAKDYSPTTGYEIKGVLLGGSGSGKTTGSMSLPGKKLLVDLDGRAESVAGFSNLDIIKVKEPNPKKPQAWEQCCEVLDELWKLGDKKGKAFPYDSVIFDGMTMMGRIAMNWVLELPVGGKTMARGPGGGPAQPHYLPQMNEMSRFILGALPLPCHVVFTGHIEVFEDNLLNTLHYWPKITGKLRTEVANWFNETYKTLVVKGKNKTEYVWQTRGIGREDFIKSSINTLGKYWKDPVKIDFDEEVTGFEKLLKLRFEGS